MDDQKLTDIVNQSGFPLQIGVESLVQRTKDQHGWKVLFTEHSWKNELDNDSGFVDIVIENQYGTVVLVLECKRVLDSSWIFLIPGQNVSSRRHAKAWISFNTDSTTYFDWADLAADPRSPQSQYCVIPGQDPKSKPMLERVAAELVSATEAIAFEEKRYKPQTKGLVRMYFSVIITTAKLRVSTIDPEKISLADGKIADAQFKEVPFVRFRKQLSTRPRSSALDIRGAAREKEHTVFVVNSESILDFLSAFDVDSDALSPYLQRQNS
jgi:hypothetical protein